MNNETSVKYQAIVSFLSRELRIKKSKIHWESRVFHDFGVDGDDATELLDLYSREFQVEIDGFDFDVYFGCESALKINGVRVIDFEK